AGPDAQVGENLMRKNRNMSPIFGHPPIRPPSGERPTLDRHVDSLSYRQARPVTPRSATPGAPPFHHPSATTTSSGKRLDPELFVHRRIRDSLGIVLALNLHPA